MSDKKTSETTPSELEARDVADGAPRSGELNRRGLLRMAAASAGLAAVGGTVLTACGGGGEDAATLDGRKAPLARKGKYDAPTITCESSTENTITIRITAGATGAPAGFSVHWVTCDQYAKGPDGTAGTTDDNSFGSGTQNCAASFSGNANGTRWNLGPNEFETVVIGGLNDADPGVSFSCNDPLTCDTCYAFRTFAHASSSANRSDFSATTQCTTAACEPKGFEDGAFCTRSQGYYGSGNDSRAAEIACFGGFGGAYDKFGVQTQAPNPGTTGATLLTIGGGTYSYTWQLTGSYVDVDNSPAMFLLDTGLKAMRDSIGGGGSSGFFTANGINTSNMGTGGGLASQTAALTLNTGSCGTSLCGGAGGAAYASAVLCNFEAGDTFKIDGTPITAATAAALNGQTVSQVLVAANAYLGGNGVVALPYGLTSAADLNELVANLNLAFDLKDWNGDAVDDCDCGGMTAFAESHLCKA